MGLKSDLFDERPCQLRINKYDFTPEMDHLGCRLTQTGDFLPYCRRMKLLGAGLEVMDKKSGEFIPIDPLPGMLLVNLGDIATMSEGAIDRGA
ncbi:LOW QUALITY PROTEIN: hypothetical protein RJ639_008364 [Escallonia herrerae]|uniref:Isopenicillin N synthase-like Fe(2+) 2OG dioxygenase domain-containing protein n=1 Tax=Escallonia herrerae TaxID=1293975 RepID=A0AA88VQN5_9ASTE|nr:LOW QUALITY PROTEIN: hypothetical protein RJ639_008364 [Escallonia herrerae]